MMQIKQGVLLCWDYSISAVVCEVIEQLKTTLIFSLKKETTICFRVSQMFCWPVHPLLLLIHSAALQRRRLTLPDSHFACIVMDTAAAGLCHLKVNIRCYRTCWANWLFRFSKEGQSFILCLIKHIREISRLRIGNSLNFLRQTVRR